VAAQCVCVRARDGGPWKLFFCTLYGSRHFVIESRRMDISFSCPHCDQHLAVDESGAGMTVNCPCCNQPVEIPRSTAQPSPSPPPRANAVKQTPPSAREKLVKCGDCGHAISSKATSCPACGAPIKQPNYAAAYVVIGIVIFFAIIMTIAVNENGSPPSTAACIDANTAQPALNSAAASMDAAIGAAKKGDTSTAASHLQSAAGSLRTAANAASADAAISQPLMRAAESYDKAAAQYASGDETGAALYSSAAIEFVKSSTDALHKTSVPRCH
jgi:ribosomal protein S27E